MIVFTFELLLNVECLLIIFLKQFKGPASVKCVVISSNPPFMKMTCLATVSVPNFFPINGSYFSLKINIFNFGFSIINCKDSGEICDN